MKTKTSPVQSCASCRWAKFERWTKHKTPRPIGVGECAWPIPILVLPTSITKIVAFRRHISPTIGILCPVWERVEAEGEK